MKIQLLATLLFMLIAVNEATVLTQCELVNTLIHHGVDDYNGYSVGDWICMAYYERGYNTTAVGPPNSDGSRDYGVFQINSRWWCSDGRGRTANGCQTSCSSFVDGNIRNDIACAMRIIDDPNGMNAWVAWRKHCKGRDVSRWTAGC